MKADTGLHVPRSLSGILKARVRRLLRGSAAEEGISEMARRIALTAETFQSEVATIIGHTYEIIAEAAFDERSGGLSDSEAIGLIRNLLDQLDDQLIEQNKNKRIIRRR
jgi:hypothetical protein